MLTQKVYKDITVVELENENIFWITVSGNTRKYLSKILYLKEITRLLK